MEKELRDAYKALTLMRADLQQTRKDKMRLQDQITEISRERDALLDEKKKLNLAFEEKLYQQKILVHEQNKQKQDMTQWKNELLQKENENLREKLQQYQRKKPQEPHLSSSSSSSSSSLFSDDDEVENNQHEDHIPSRSIVNIPKQQESNENKNHFVEEKEEEEEKELIVKEKLGMLANMYDLKRQLEEQKQFNEEERKTFTSKLEESSQEIIELLDLIRVLQKEKQTFEEMYTQQVNLVHTLEETKCQLEQRLIIQQEELKQQLQQQQQQQKEQQQEQQRIASSSSERQEDLQLTIDSLQKQLQDMSKSKQLIEASLAFEKKKLQDQRHTCQQLELCLEKNNVQCKEQQEKIQHLQEYQIKQQKEMEKQVISLQKKLTTFLNINKQDMGMQTEEKTASPTFDTTTTQTFILELSDFSTQTPLAPTRIATMTQTQIIVAEKETQTESTGSNSVMTKARETQTMEVYSEEVGTQTEEQNQFSTTITNCVGTQTSCSLSTMSHKTSQTEIHTEDTSCQTLETVTVQMAVAETQTIPPIQEQMTETLTPSTNFSKEMLQMEIPEKKAIDLNILWHQMSLQVRESMSSIEHLMRWIQNLVQALDLWLLNQSAIQILSSNNNKSTQLNGKQLINYMNQLLWLTQETFVYHQKCCQSIGIDPNESSHFFQGQLLQLLNGWYENPVDAPVPSFSLQAKEISLILENYSSIKSTQQQILQWLETVSSLTSLDEYDSDISTDTHNKREYMLKLKTMTCEVKEAFLMLIVPLLKQNQHIQVRVWTRRAFAAINQLKKTNKSSQKYKYNQILKQLDLSNQQKENVWEMKIHIQRQRTSMKNNHPEYSKSTNSHLSSKSTMNPRQNLYQLIQDKLTPLQKNKKNVT